MLEETEIFARQAERDWSLECGISGCGHNITAGWSSELTAEQAVQLFLEWGWSVVREGGKSAMVCPYHTKETSKNPLGWHINEY